MRDYRRRLLNQVQTHCDVEAGLRKIKAAEIPRDALGNFEKLIIGGAVERFEAPMGPERTCVRRDGGGREVRHFFGDAEAIWLPYTNATATNGTLVGWRTGRIVKPAGQNLDACAMVVRQGRTTFD